MEERIDLQIRANKEVTINYAHMTQCVSQLIGSTNAAQSQPQSRRLRDPWSRLAAARIRAPNRIVTHLHSTSSERSHQHETVTWTLCLLQSIDLKDNWMNIRSSVIRLIAISFIISPNPSTMLLTAILSPKFSPTFTIRKRLTHSRNSRSPCSLVRSALSGQLTFILSIRFSTLSSLSQRRPVPTMAARETCRTWQLPEMPRTWLAASFSLA